MPESKLTKICIKCKISKDATLFPHLRNRCRECVNRYAQNWYIKNQEKQRRERKLKYNLDISKGIFRPTTEKETKRKKTVYEIFKKEKNIVGTNSFYVYKRRMLYSNAKKRGIFFSLTSKEVKSIFQNFPYNNCPYCHQPITQPSVDRKNNEKGYFLENCILVCLDCNNFKSNKSKLRIKEIYFHLFGDVKPSEIK